MHGLVRVHAYGYMHSIFSTPTAACGQDWRRHHQTAPAARRPPVPVPDTHPPSPDDPTNACRHECSAVIHRHTRLLGASSSSCRARSEQQPPPCSGRASAAIRIASPNAFAPRLHTGWGVLSACPERLPARRGRGAAAAAAERAWEQQRHTRSGPWRARHRSVRSARYPSPSIDSNGLPADPSSRPLRP